MGEELEIPLKPVTRSDIHRLETALMIVTLLRDDVLEKIKDPQERITWIDSLAVAAAAIARYKAGMSVSSIADELGRTEATIRRHISGESEAGKLVLETYGKFVKEGVKITLPSILEEAGREKREEDVEGLRKRVSQLENEIGEVRSKIKVVASRLRELAGELEKI